MAVAGGFWNLLSFSIADGDGGGKQAMRMASDASFKRKICSYCWLVLAKTQAKPCISLLSFSAMRVGYWGFGLVCLARFSLVELPLVFKGCLDLRLLIAFCYSGFLFWAWWISGFNTGFLIGRRDGKNI